MSAFPSLPLFTDAFIADTVHLNAQETGAYLMLLMVAWRTPECRLPDDDARLCRWARVDPRTWGRIKPKVMEFWRLADGHWTQKRLTQERDIVSKRAEAARTNGRHGGRPKSLKIHDQKNRAGSAGLTQAKAPSPSPSPIAASAANEAVDQRGENDRLEAALREAAGLENDPNPGLLSLAPIHGLIAEGFDFEKHILPVVRTKRGKRFSSWAYIVEAVRERGTGRHRAAATAPPAYRPPPDPDAYLAALSDERWRDAIRHWQRTCGAWDLHRHTPPPDDPRTKVPRRFLDEFEVKQFAPVTRLVTLAEQMRGAA